MKVFIAFLVLFVTVLANKDVEVEEEIQKWEDYKVR